jgi:hypothetical protein
MKRFAALTITTALLCACSPSGSSVTHRVAQTTPSLADHSSSSAAAEFCSAAREIGRVNLGLADTGDDVDTVTMLANIDRLDSIAPADLKADMDYFTSFEHAALDPASGKRARTQSSGQTAKVLKRVADYFRDQCHL